jgi:hypothetical protein
MNRLLKHGKKPVIKMSRTGTDAKRLQKMTENHLNFMDKIASHE